MLERTPPVSPEKPLIPFTKVEKILVKESRNETPVDVEQAKLLQTPKKVSENKKLGVEEDGDAKSAVSERTRLSIAAVSFTKDCKVVRTISFDADEVVADTISPNKQKAEDETSGRTFFCFQLCFTICFLKLPAILRKMNRKSLTKV